MPPAAYLPFLATVAAYCCLPKWKVSSDLAPSRGRRCQVTVTAGAPM